MIAGTSKMMKALTTINPFKIYKFEGFWSFSAASSTLHTCAGEMRSTGQYHRGMMTEKIWD